MPRRKRGKGQKGLSQYEEIYAKLLYGEGASQKHIAEVLAVSDSVISQLKKDSEDWEEYRIPELSINELLRLIKKHISRITLKLIAGRYDDTESAVNEMWRVAASMEKLYNLVEASTLMGKIDGVKDAMKWMIDNGRQGSLEDLQEYHDEQVKKL